METSEVPSQTETTASFARKLVLELQQAILLHEPGAIAGDVEAVHNMRVGIRRLRVAIKNFAACFSKEDRQRWRDSMENLANALGEVRDLDVMIIALKSQQASIINNPAEEQEAFASFIVRLEARRRRRLRKLLAYFRREEYAGFKRGFSFDEPASFSDIVEASYEQAV